MNRILLVVILSVAANSALAIKESGPVAATPMQESACPANMRAHVTKINVKSDGNYAGTAIVRLDQSGQLIEVRASDPPKVGWFICGPVASN